MRKTKLDSQSTCTKLKVNLSLYHTIPPHPLLDLSLPPRTISTKLQSWILVILRAGYLSPVNHSPTSNFQTVSQACSLFSSLKITNKANCLKGKCRDIKEFEKLNQLGEGSPFARTHSVTLLQFLVLTNSLIEQPTG